MTRSLATILFLALGVGACTESTDVAPVGGALENARTAAPVRPPNPHATPASMVKQDSVRGVADPEDDLSPGQRGVADPEDDYSLGKRTRQDLVRGTKAAKVGRVAAP